LTRLFLQEKFEAAIQSASKSIELDSTYVKALGRRAESYKHIDKLDEALEDYQKILELDPANVQARHEIHVSSS
jgi:tetratricopeptide (TPR) repeat protein